jgi:hypothetical protein
LAEGDFLPLAAAGDSGGALNAVREKRKPPAIKAAPFHLENPERSGFIEPEVIA